MPCHAVEVELSAGQSHAVEASLPASLRPEYEGGDFYSPSVMTAAPRACLSRSKGGGE